MTLFGEAVVRVRERVKAAPVDDYLKQEARDDLRRLIEAHELMLAERAEKDVETRQSQPDKWDRASWRHQALDFALRSGIHYGNAQAAVNDAKAFEAYLKGE